MSHQNVKSGMVISNRLHKKGLTEMVPQKWLNLKLHTKRIYTMKKDTHFSLHPPQLKIAGYLIVKYAQEPHVHTCIYVRVRLRVRARVCVFVRVCLYMRACVCVFMRVYVCASVLVCARAWVRGVVWCGVVCVNAKNIFTLNSPTTLPSSSSSFPFPRCNGYVFTKSVNPQNPSTSSNSVR